MTREPHPILPETSPPTISPRLAQVTAAPQIPVPAGRRVPFGWRVLSLAPAGQGPDVTFRWPQGEIGGPSGRIRIGVAIETREPKAVQVTLGVSNRVLGTFDLRFAPALQTFDLPLNLSDLTDVVLEGVTLRQTVGAEPLWIFHEPSPVADGRLTFLPHLIFAGSNPLVEFYNRLASKGVAQPFGLAAGCVMEGLWDLSQKFGAEGFRPNIEAMLRLYFDPAGRFTYERPRSVPSDGVLYGLEACLPTAAIARIWRTHPILEYIVRFWNSRLDSRGVMSEPDGISAEASLSVCYPLAVLARLRRRPDLLEMAHLQLRVRQHRLVDGDDLYQSVLPDGTRTLRNGSQAVACYLMGLVRTLTEADVKTAPDDLKAEASRVADLCVARQLPSGLWPAFLGEESTGPDTCASAGIAAALVLGTRKGLFPAPLAKAGARAISPLIKHLGPDGMLAGGAPPNRAPEPLLRSGYRLITAQGMGYMAQLLAQVLPSDR